MNKLSGIYYIADSCLGLCKRLCSTIGVITLAGLAMNVFAQPFCDEQQTTKRRRPGQVECVPRPQQQETGQQPAAETQGARRRTTSGESRTPQARPVLPRRESPIPRPALKDFQDSIPVPDRWRLVDTLGYTEKWWDPYNRNPHKADKPLHGDWFYSIGIVSDSVYEKRDLVTPVGSSSSAAPGSIDVFGESDQWVANQNLLLELVYYKGDTTFRPPDYEFRLIPVLNYNYAELEEIQGVNADPQHGKTRDDHHLAWQGAFADIHLRNVSDNYDFDSFRIGIQPFSADFRGFLFLDSPFGVRLFGTRHNNVFQYNLAWFRRLEKDTNSGLNDVSEPLRDDDIVVANLYWQDFPSRGFFSQATVLHNRNREDEFFYDANDFIVRPASIGREALREYDTTYFGYSGDGHCGRWNLSLSAYAVMGEEKGSVFRPQDTEIAAYFFAAELSRDFDWLRVRASLLWASGDDDPFDKKARGFDAIFENPQFAGADTSYWIRQAVPLAGGGRVALSGRNGLLPSLRSSKEQGQSNFINPGLQLFGLGVDMDLLPELRVSANWNALAFDNTSVLEVARNQGDIDRDIGQDISVSLIYRPLLNQNIVLRASYATLVGEDGYNALFKHEDSGYLLLNAVLQY